MNSDIAIFATLKESLTKRTPCVVSFFPEEVLLTMIDAAKQKALKKEKKDQALSGGSGKLKASFTALSAVTDYAEAIRMMERQEIRGENTRTIPREDIRQMRFTEAKERQSVDNASNVKDDGKLTMKLLTGRLTLIHGERDLTGRMGSYIKGYLS